MQEGVWLPHVTWSEEGTHHVLRLRHGTRPERIKRCSKQVKPSIFTSLTSAGEVLCNDPNTVFTWCHIIPWCHISMSSQYSQSNKDI